MTPEERSGLLREFRRLLNAATEIGEVPTPMESRAMFATSALAVSVILAADSIAELAKRLPPPEEE